MSILTLNNNNAFAVTQHISLLHLSLLACLSIFDWERDDDGDQTNLFLPVLNPPSVLFRVSRSSRSIVVYVVHVVLGF